MKNRLPNWREHLITSESILPRKGVGTRYPAKGLALSPKRIGASFLDLRPSVFAIVSSLSEENRQSVVARVPSLERIRSGIGDFDKLIRGGLPKGTVTLVYGAPKTGKSTFAYHFLMEAVRRELPCVFIMTDYGSEQLSRVLSSFGWDISDSRRKGNVRLVVMTSSEEIDGESTPGPLKYVSLTSLTDLMIRTMESLKPTSLGNDGFRIVLDSLTPMFIYNPPMIVAKFLREFAHRMKNAGSAGILITYVAGSIDPQSEFIIKSSVDNLIFLGNHELVVEGIVGSPRVTTTYQITDEGIKVGS